MTIKLTEDEAKFIKLLFSDMSFKIGKSREMILAESILKKVSPAITPPHLRNKTK